MRAELKGLHSPDIDNLETYMPDNAECFGFFLQALFGPEGADGEESFGIEVCTPSWLAVNHSQDEIVIGRHRLIIFEYSYPRLLNFLRRFGHRCVGREWGDVAAQLSTIGKWEFEGYREAPAPPA
ncbi:MAG TPA: immunity 8 family protein [Pseudomonadales bacterium]|nr:immunity 8 family protein [Pseudomonadales bacterium]